MTTEMTKGVDTSLVSISSTNQVVVSASSAPCSRDNHQSGFLESHPLLSSPQQSQTPFAVTQLEIPAQHSSTTKQQISVKYYTHKLLWQSMKNMHNVQ